MNKKNTVLCFLNVQEQHGTEAVFASSTLHPTPKNTLQGSEQFYWREAYSLMGLVYMSVDVYFLTQQKYLHNRLPRRLFLLWAWIIFVRKGTYANQNMYAYINTAFVDKVEFQNVSH